MKRIIWPTGLFFLSVAFIITGLLMDEYWFVLEKAINICLSCIGIG